MSGRVNHLLRRALDLERKERLEQDAEKFFAGQHGTSLGERVAFLKASRRTVSRD